MSLLRSLQPLSTAPRLFHVPANRTFTRTLTSPLTSTSKMATTESSLPAQAPTLATPLPKLNQHDFRIYNRMAEHMDYFHNKFRATWNVLYEAAESGRRGKGMSIRQFISLGQDFCGHLEMHHGVEERHIFPMLAKKQPAFKKELELLTQHKQIHKGLDKLQKYLDECASAERELRLSEIKEIMDGFGKVLWQHLDDEVKELGAENMRKYWTKEEMLRMPM